MKTFVSAALFAAITTAAAPAALAGMSTNEAVTLCKDQAETQFAQEGVDTRVKFKGTKRKDGATQVRLQVYPKGQDSYKATCSLDRKSGELVSLVREGEEAGVVAQK